MLLLLLSQQLNIQSISIILFHIQLSPHPYSIRPIPYPFPNPLHFPIKLIFLGKHNINNSHLCGKLR